QVGARDRHAVARAGGPDQSPAMVWQAGAVERASQPRVMTDEGPPVLLACAGRRRQAFPVAVNQPVRAGQQHRAAPSRADVAEQREQLDRSHRPGCLLVTAVHVPATGRTQGPGSGTENRIWAPNRGRCQRPAPKITSKASLTNWLSTSGLNAGL